MTTNQIEYLKLRETQRANQAQEQLTATRDATNRELGFANLGENTRHNKATEAHNTAVLGETARHNLAQEKHNQNVLIETSRHNQATEANERFKAEEGKRHNLETEAAAWGQLSVAQGQLDVSNRQVIELGRHNLATETETRRSNLAREQETYRSNVSRERETNRSNLAHERELNRHNLASESIGRSQVGLGYSQLAEQSRHNTVSETQEHARIDEMVRSNLAKESETRRSNIARLDEEHRSNTQQEWLRQQQISNEYKIGMRNVQLRRQEIQETQRANLEREEDEDARVWQSGFQTAGKFAEGVSNAARIIIPIFGG